MLASQHLSWHAWGPGVFSMGQRYGWSNGGRDQEDSHLLCAFAPGLPRCRTVCGHPLSTPRVGTKINDGATIDRLGLDRKRLARLSVESYLQQILRHGFFHADPVGTAG